VIRDELGLIARENQQQTRPLIQSYLEKFQTSLTEKVKTRLVKELPAWKGNLWKLARRYEEWVSDTLSEEMRQLSQKEHHNFFGTLKKAHASFSRSLEIFRKFLGENIQKVLGVQLADIEWKIDVAEPDHPDIAFTKSFDIHLDLMWFLIPMFIFRKFFESHFIKGLPKEVEINLSRLAYQWEKRINAAIEAMRVQAVTYVHEELATIEVLLSQTEGQTEEIRELISIVKQQAKYLGS
jgi:translation elongation factor EF-1beta